MTFGAMARADFLSPNRKGRRSTWCRGAAGASTRRQAGCGSEIAAAAPSDSFDVLACSESDVRGFDDPDVAVFHAGTSFDDERIVTAGGRVLSVCALGDTVEAARAKAYETLAKIKFTGMQFRTDIGLA